MRWTSRKALREALAITAILLALSSGSWLLAQEFPYDAPYGPSEQSPPLLSPGQLTNLVAPIALYPDPLLSQVLVVSTYPEQLAEAQQWLQQNGNLQGEQLMYAARQQNWDPSVQALVAFPDVMALLCGNLQWTEDLGQAFLAQPTDVMNAIQNLRARARNNGQLVSTPQLSVHTEFQGGQSAIEILPARPEVMYVPAYNPYSVWGPPDAGAYPELPYEGSTFGSLLGTAINLAGMFAGFPGLLGPSGWGWALSWLAHTLFVNNGFLSDFGFRNRGGGYFGSSVWVHDEHYRDGAPYGLHGGGWRAFGGGSRMFPAAHSGRTFAPRRWTGRESLRAGNRAARGGDWRRFQGATRRPAYQATGQFARPSWNSSRNFQASNRFAGSNHFGTSSRYRATLNNWRSRAPSYRGFSRPYGGRAPSAFSGGRQSGRSWLHPFRSSQPRMDSPHGFWGGRSSVPRGSFKQPRMPRQPRMPKQRHFSAPHFKSHGSSHSSRGHSGGRSRRR